MKTKNIATFLAILAAALYAINIPVSKVLLEFVQPTMMAAFLYLGAGVGLFFYGRCTRAKGERLTRRTILHWACDHGRGNGADGKGHDLPAAHPRA